MTKYRSSPPWLKNPGANACVSATWKRSQAHDRCRSRSGGGYGGEKNLRRGVTPPETFFPRNPAKL